MRTAVFSTVTRSTSSAWGPTKTIRPSCAATTESRSGEMEPWEEPRRGAGPVQVAMTSAFSIRKLAGCTHQLLRNALHAYALQAISLAGDDCDCALWHLQHVREHLDELGICRAFDGRRVETDEQRATTRAGQPGPRRPRNHL